jgi:UV DNA damage endonuclease
LADAFRTAKRAITLKIGYPCVNRSIGCSSSHTFRLASYSEATLRKSVKANLCCLERALKYNADHGIFFFRITSDLVPFASHPVCKLNWQSEFRDAFASLGELIRRNSMRISMHPDQFVLINARDRATFSRSVSELEYHVDLLDLLGLDHTAKVQIHVGGVYGDRSGSMARFTKRYLCLEERIRDRLALENDDINYSLEECLSISHETGIPVIFDAFHHQINGDGKGIRDCLGRCKETWAVEDGLPMVDYSSQEKGERRGKHSRSLDRALFAGFLKESHPFDIDVMLEIKDKEASALVALAIADGDPRLWKTS